MSDSFDPTGYLTFDLGSGSLRLAAGSGALVLPFETLERHLASEGGAALAATFARSLGEWMGETLRTELGGPGGGADPGEASPERFLDRLNGLLSVHGLGRYEFETFGDVLLIRAAAPSPLPRRRARLLESLFSGLLARFGGQETACIVLEDSERPCLLVASPTAARRAAALLEQGLAPEAVAARLHTESRPAAEAHR